jgi:hypothetical protein
MRVIRAQVTASAGIRLPCLLQRKFVGGVAAVASFLDDMTAFTESGTDLLRDTEVFPLDSHPFEADGMTALPKIGQFLFMAFPAFFREDHGLLFGSGLVVDVAAHAMDSFFCMF